MNFDQWWDTLTIKEQTVIGKNNARFVWQQACEACAKVVEASPSYDWHRFACEAAADIRQLGESK